jgi:transposase
MMAAEKNRLHAASLSEALPAIIRRDLQRSIQTQQRAIDRLTRAALEFIAQDPELARRSELLLSIPGCGATSAVHLLAELNLLPADLDVRQWVAYAGLDPREYTSGTSVHKKVRISNAGNKHLRRALYLLRRSRTQRPNRFLIWTTLGQAPPLHQNSTYFLKGSPPCGECLVSTAARASAALGVGVLAKRISFASIFLP